MAGPGGREPIDVIIVSISQNPEAAGPPPAAAGSGADPSLWETLTHAGPIGFTTLAILVVFSVASWAIIGFKWWQLRRAARTSERFLTAFWESKRLDQMYQQTEPYARSPICQMFRSGYVELARLKRKAGDDDLATGTENVERALRKSQRAEITSMESMTSFLATVGSTSPFIGLFGTVWGIMKAFREIGRAGSANLATVAPGISEALIATAAGLAAAIPAVIAFNYFASRIRVIESEMEAFASDFLNIVKRHFYR